MIRLVVSDVDGTLLQNGAKALSRKTLDQIDALCSRGIIFAAASGREYSNLYRLFGRVQDKIMYICLNGASIIYKGKIICQTVMDRQMGLEIIEDIESRRGCEVLLSGVNTCYVKGRHRSYVNHIIHDVGNDTTIVRNFDEVEEDFLKISAYNPNGIQEDQDFFLNKWGGILPTVVSGACWIDFNGPYVNKGNALSVVQKLYDIKIDETMTFGDNFNDLDMFDRSYYSYAISSSDPEIRKRARFLTPTVESILFDVLRMR